MRRRPGARKRPPVAAAAGRRIGSLAAGLLLVGIILAATADERLFGVNPDGRIMLRTAFAVAELGEIGIARGDAVTVDRPAGDAVSGYGLLPSFALVPAVWLAAPFEKAFGAGSSQFLFALHQILLLVGAAAGAGELARALGGDGRTVFRAATGAVLSSPLWAYASSDLSEPLQAALVALAFAAASAAVAPGVDSSRARRMACVAGVAAGGALLSRSLLVFLVFAVLGVLGFSGSRAERRSRLLFGLVGFLPAAALWAALDVQRFGGLFGGYSGQRFSHPVANGAWRLLVGGNRGLVLFFPLAILGIAGLVRGARRGTAAAIVASAFSLALFLTAAAWWAWDGTVGWGPRLILPTVPILAAFAACEAAAWRPAVFRTLFAAGVAVNALAVLEPDVAVKTYLSILPARTIDERETVRYPVWAFSRGPTGAALLDAPYWTAREAALSPFRLAPWLLWQRLAGGDVGRRLEDPPWNVARPGLGPVRPLAQAMPPEKLAFLTGPVRWPFLGRSLFPESTWRGWNPAYLDAVKDQAHRAEDQGRADRAVTFSERLWAGLPTPETAVDLAESYRLAGRTEAVLSLGDSLHASGGPVDVRFYAVLALLARDLGEAGEAGTLMAKAADSTRNEALRKWRDVPAAEWPRTLRALTGESERPRGRL